MTKLYKNCEKTVKMKQKLAPAGDINTRGVCRQSRTPLWVYIPLSEAVVEIILGLFPTALSPLHSSFSSPVIVYRVSDLYLYLYFCGRLEGVCATGVCLSGCASGVWLCELRRAMCVVG